MGASELKPDLGQSVLAWQNDPLPFPQANPTVPAQRQHQQGQSQASQSQDPTFKPPANGDYIVFIHFRS
jgi:hypothetical protein